MDETMTTEQKAELLDLLVGQLNARIDEAQAVCDQYKVHVDVFKTFGKAAYDACTVSCSQVELLTLEEVSAMIFDLTYEMTGHVGDYTPE